MDHRTARILNTMLTTTMRKQGIEKQEDNMQSQAMSTMGVEIAASVGCRSTSSSLVNKQTTGAELIGINAADIDFSSKLASVVSVDDSDHESITSNGDDGKPPAVATNKLVPYTGVVSLGWLRASRTLQRCFSHIECCPSFPFACMTAIKHEEHAG
jgi:hypothetical protein